jgi:signal-transduction protein with cAMP-binding, CBS, and nucleotidyltransferase domain
MLKQRDTLTTIKTIPWFLELSNKSLDRLSIIADFCFFKPGDIIFNEGEQHAYLYVILYGKVILESIIPGHGTLPVFTAESLDVIGWSSLTPVVRQKTSTARVVEPTKLLSFHAEKLMELCESDCELGFIIMRRLANIVATRYLTHRIHLLEKFSTHRE